MQEKRGFSLFEVAIAVVLAALVVLGLVKLYMNMKHGRQVASAVNTMQQQGRFVLSTLGRYIRSAGDASCLSSSVQPERVLIGYKGDQVPAQWQIKPLSGTGVIVVGECTSKQGQQRYQQFAFYAANTGRKNAHGQVITALYKKPWHGRAVEISPGVDGLRFAYGLSAVGGKDIQQYQQSVNVHDWSQVRSVQIALSLTAGDAAMRDIGAGHLFKVWHSYVALQNRLH